MQSSNFKGSNAQFGPPEGQTESEVRTIFALRTKDAEGQSRVITCWRVDGEELLEIARTGRVWLTVQGELMPPVNVSGTRPDEWTRNDVLRALIEAAHSGDIKQTTEMLALAERLVTGEA